MINFHEISNWKKFLGLLPINLFLESEVNDSYILHNGSKGDFCLSFSEHEQSTINSRAWSSNTNNYLTLTGNKVQIYNWKKRKPPESIPISLIQNNYEKFYNYLIDDNYSSGNDIAPFVLNIFRQLRNSINEVDGGLISLNSLFYLLAITEDEKGINEINKTKWGLENINFQINEVNLEPFVESLKKGIYDLTPNIELIIRHSAGMLFQEAHQDVAFFNKQMTLFGSNYSSDIKFKNKFYSSTHYTPTYIARTIVENILKEFNFSEKKHLKILDPACGTSIFLLETLKQLVSIGYEGTVDIVGWDISQAAINTSSFILSYEKREWKDKLNIDLRLVDDSLTTDWDRDYDIILMNPPFISWEQMSKAERESVSGSLGKSVKNKPNMASAFFKKATINLSKDGVLGCVIPSSLLTYDSYKPLRNEIEGYFKISFISKLGNYVFENALTDISIIIGGKSDKLDDTLILSTDNSSGIISEALHELRKFNYNQLPYVSNQKYSIYYPDIFPLSKENWKPLSIDDNKFLKGLDIYIRSKKLILVSDLFSVNQGIRTGNNKVFKITKSYFHSLPEKERTFFKPTIENSTIYRGRLKKASSYVWYPYSYEGLIINSELELRTQVPTYYNDILLPNRDKLINRARKNENDWWTLSEHRAWLRKSEPRLVSTEFGSSNSFAFDINGKYLIERGNAWIPKKKIETNDFYFFYLAVFSSSIFNKLLNIYSKQLLKGVYLGYKHTKNIPIPNFERSLNRHLIADLGKKLHYGELIDTSIIDSSLEYPHFTQHI